MNIDEKIINRFDELILKSNKVILTNTPSGVLLGRNFVDSEISNEWKILCLNLLRRVFGIDSVHYQKFESVSVDIVYFDNVKSALGILKAAKNDYENGYLFDTRALIEAEIFSDILEQSEELLKKGHYQVSAVVAGCVLEDGLRKLCNKNNITFPKKPTIEPMNVELAKMGIYNQFIKDKISSIGKLRNHAAHGEWNEFNNKDVEDMINDVRRFMEDYFI
jgi:hypothetical protein